LFLDDATRAHGFLKDGATYTTLEVPGATDTVASGINDFGQIVGYFYDATGGHGFLATPNDWDGRRYTIAVSATDKAGNRGGASATVTLPHN
jgi:probable HAF family extracellular repeat protein